MTNKKILLCIFLILSLISITAVSAQDNTTVSEIQAIDDIEEIQVNNDLGDTQEEIVSASDNGTGKVGEGDDIYAQTMYFNASAPSDGDGSRLNPYKYVTDARLPYGVTAYFANGVYELNGNIDLYSNDGSELFSYPSKVTLFGESTDGVIFKCINSSNVAFIVNDNSRCYAYNMTFDNAVVQNNGRFEAYGCVFKNGVAVDTTASYYSTRNNAFGGAIYSPGSHYATYGSGMKSYLTLENCLFMNNSAVYGGSIYHKYGNTIIRNTKFIDSYASLYGGVLATDGGDILIENCEFLNYRASGDAGGAIYSKVTNLTVKNANFTNGYADFGGAICDLNSDLIVENANFYNNTAKYEGGAIYIMYGDISISKCNITLSSALDGGALFIDNCTSVDLIKTNFKQSSANRYGGTIFSNGNEATIANDVTFADSTAPIGPVVYHQDKYDYDIGYNADYQLMKYNSSYEGVLPARYDLREEGFVTPIRDQEGGGNCWAFAGIAALESCIYKATGKSIDLSEENVKNLVELYSAYGWQEDTNEGGHSEMTWGNLISWIGPVLESDDPYDDYSTLSTLMNAVMHVQNVYYLPARTSALDNNAIKKAIMDYGAVSVVMYADFDSPINYDEKTASYFFAVGTPAYVNHAVTVVGWDDNYDKNKFPMGDMAGSNGAWIVKNSWNTDWGDNGYFYISYYDPSVFEVGKKNVAYTFILNDTVKYNRNYQYDIGGMTDYLYPTGNNQTLYYKNTFTSIGSDILTAVSTIFEDAMDYEVNIYINDELKHTQSGHSFAGYNTIPLTKEYQLTSGDNFTVQFKISQAGGASIPICEVVTATRLTYSEGISFFSTNGNTWNDLYTFTLDRPDIEHIYASQVACIKAFTRASGIILGSSMELGDVNANTGEVTQIKAIVKDENGKLVNTGFVTFDIGGKKETVKVADGIAVLETTFDSEGTFNVNAIYDGGDNYKNSTDTAKVTVAKSIVKSTTLEASNLEYTYGESKAIEATLKDIDGNPVFNADVTMIINGNTYTVKTDKNGVASFDVSLAVGEYLAKFEFAGTSSFIKSSTSATVKVSSAGNITSDVANVQYNYADDGSVSAIVTDENGNAIAFAEVTLTVGDKTYFAQTDSDGVAKFNPDLANGEYSASISVAGKSVSPSAPKTIKVDKKTQTATSTIEAKDTVRAQGSSYEIQAKFYDAYGSPLADKEVSFELNGNDYFLKTDEYGVVKFSNNMVSGNYSITINNPATGESVVKNITIVKRITGNTNVQVDYTYSKDYAVRVYGDNGNVVGAGEVVTFKINGKTATATTNSEGYATYKIKGLLPKTYTITAEYKGVKVSNKVVVKQILKSKNVKVKKSAKTKKFTATLKTTAGKAIKNKKITFKIKGKTYSGKTNSKGVATVKVTKNLKVGKYSVLIKYKKTSIKKTLTIKK